MRKHLILDQIAAAKKKTHCVIAKHAMYSG